MEDDEDAAVKSKKRETLSEIADRVNVKSKKLKQNSFDLGCYWLWKSWRCAHNH